MQLICIACAVLASACSPRAPASSTTTPATTPVALDRSQASEPAAAQATPIKVVVITMFEEGAVTGDDPGELQYWVERLPLPIQHSFPAGPFPLYSNTDGVLAICTGGGIANATASILALGLDPRFDLRDAYFLVAGIAGGDPADTSLGSAVWAQHVVDGDLLYEIDAREIPADWPYGIIPLGGSEPADTPADLSTGWSLDTIHFALNPSLARWAFELTKDLPLKDTEGMASFRAGYTDQPKAQQPPAVSVGDTLSASTYWHGARLNTWANDWIRLYAGETANFVTSNMEDSGTLTALTRLGELGKVRPERTLVLRTVSNYTTPPANLPATASATLEYPDRGEPSLDSAYRVGSTVVQALLTTPPNINTER